MRRADILSAGDRTVGRDRATECCPSSARDSFQVSRDFICDKSRPIRYKPRMSAKSMLLPMAAFAGSAAFLIWQHAAHDPVRQQATLFRETIQMVTTHHTEARARAAAATKDKAGRGSTAVPAEASRADIDLKELAKAMAGMRNGMPDMKAMLKLQKTILELSPEELSALITDAGQLDLPAAEKDSLVMMLIQGLAESDPKAAVLAAAEFMQTAPKSPHNMMSYPMRNAFSSWAKKDLTAAMAWFDGAVAAGQFENTALSDVNEQQTQMIGSVLKQLVEKDPDSARQRLLALSEKERSAVLANTNGFEKDEASQKRFSELARGILPEKDQVNALKRLAEQVYSKDSLDGVTRYFTAIEATPEERKTLASGVADSSIRQRTWDHSTDKPNMENSTKLRTWLSTEVAADGEAILGKSLASSARAHGNYSPAQALALVTELHTAQPSDELLLSFLDQSKPKSNLEAWQTLAGKIADPAARATALEKLAKPAD